MNYLLLFTKKSELAYLFCSLYFTNKCEIYAKSGDKNININNIIACIADNLSAKVVKNILKSIFNFKNSICLSDKYVDRSVKNFNSSSVALCDIMKQNKKEVIGSFAEFTISQWYYNDFCF